MLILYKWFWYNDDEIQTFKYSTNEIIIFENTFKINLYIAYKAIYKNEDETKIFPIILNGRRIFRPCFYFYTEKIKYDETAYLEVKTRA